MKPPRETLLSFLRPNRPKTRRGIGGGGIRVTEVAAYLLVFTLGVATVGGFLRWHIASLYAEELASWRERQSSVADDQAQRVSDCYFPSPLTEDASYTVSVSSLGTTRIAIVTFTLLALTVLTFLAGRRDPSVRRLVRPLTHIFFAVMGGMAAYEGLKMFAFPHATMGESHLMTIGVSSVVAVVAAHFALQRKSRLLEGAAMELRGREQAEQALRLSEAKQREALLAAQMGLWEWTVATDTVTWDENLYRIAGLDPKLPAPSFQEQQKIYPPESWKQLKAAVEKAVATGSSYEYDLEMVRPDGSTRWVIGRGEPLRDARGNITQFRGTLQDITDRKRAEQELRRVNRALRTITECNQVLVRAVEEPVLLKDICEILVGVGGYRMAWVGFAEPDEGKSVRPVTHAGFEDGYLQTANITWADTERGQGPTGTAIRTGKSAVARFIDHDPRLAPWREDARKRGYASSAALPILVNSQALGTLTIYSQAKDAFDAQEVQLLTELSHDLAYGIQALRTRAERERAEAALRKSEEQYRALFERNLAGVLVTTWDGGILDCNPSMANILGFTSPQEARDRRMLDFYFSPTERAKILKKVEAEGRLTNFETQLRRKDGSPVWLMGNINLQPQAADGLRIIEGIFVDITERKLAEAENARLAVIVNSSDDAIFSTTSEGLVASWNAGAERMYGYAAEEIKGKHISALIPEDRRGDLAVNQEKLYRGESLVHLEFEHVRQDGARLQVSETVSPIRDATGFVIGVSVIARDVTESRRVEQALHESERKYRELVQHANSIILRWTRDGRVLFLNEFGQRFFGYTEAEICGRHVVGTLVPETESTGRRLPPMMDEICANPAAFEQVVNENIRRNGERVWIAWTNKVVLNQQGQAAEILSIGTDITARKRAEEALRVRETQLSLIHNNSYDVMFAIGVESNHHFRFISVNHKFTEVTGLQENQVVGKLIQEIIPEPACAFVVEKYHEAVRNGRPIHWEEVSDYPAGRKTGEVAVAPVFDAGGNCTQLIGTVHDVTERKHAEEELRRSESKYRTLVETSQDVIWSVDNECRITFMSPAARHVYGYEPEELLGRHITDLVPPEGLDRELQEIERVMVSGASEGYEHAFLRKDGTPVYLSCNSVALRDDHGHVIGAMGVSTDITERKRAEEELRAIQANLERRVMERTAELAVARDRAEMADRTKSAFLATMSHELRTPLNSIIGFTGLLLQGLAGPLNPEQAKQLGMVKESGQHLLALINDVLDISKIEAGQIEIANAPFDLPESIQKVVQTVTPLANKKMLSLISQIAPGVGQITSDRRRVEQILLNLLSNAIKFTERGEVTLTAEITTGTRHDPRPAVHISVSDTGIGIKRENLDKLFQPFRQLDTGLTRQHEGTGLGLAICKRLVERLGGTITVESEWGKGSTFECVLPIHPERKS